MNAVKIYLQPLLLVWGLLLTSGCKQKDSLSSPEESTAQDEQSLHKAGEGNGSVAASTLTLDLTSGATGTVLLNQSFAGETRGVEVTVLGASNLCVTAITLDEFNLTGNRRRLGARIYQSTGSLLAAAEATVKKGINQSVTIPIFATLLAGSRYRIAYFIPAGQGSSGNTADVFDPAPDGFGGFPYTELNGLLRLEEAFSIASDSFPSNPNTVVPMFKVKIRQPKQ